MATYLKQFSTHAEYEAYINGSGAILPNVSICTTEGDVHYNPYVEPVETRVAAKFNVTDASSPTKIAYGTSGISAIEIDGVEQPNVTTGYTFSATGEHTVKYTLANPTSIGEMAFTLCSALTSITIPNSVTSIDERVFYGCSGLTSIVIPDSVTSIGDGAFNKCAGLTSVSIGNGVTSIGSQAFYDCNSLTSITIPNSVTSIWNSAFYRCSGLTSVTIGNSVTSIGDSAFYKCSSLASITVETVTPPTLKNGGGLFITNNCPIYVPCNSVDTYKAATNWSTYASRIQAIPGSCS